MRRSWLRVLRFYGWVFIGLGFLSIFYYASTSALLMAPTMSGVRSYFPPLTAVWSIPGMIQASLPLLGIGYLCFEAARLHERIYRLEDELAAREGETPQS